MRSLGLRRQEKAFPGAEVVGSKGAIRGEGLHGLDDGEQTAVTVIDGKPENGDIFGKGEV